VLWKNIEIKKISECDMRHFTELFSFCVKFQNKVNNIPFPILFESDGSFLFRCGVNKFTVNKMVEI
jgi:hypothetical protein